MYTKNQIFDILASNKPLLESKYPISELGFFGSYARGEAKEDSDIDVLLDFNGKIGLEFIKLAHYLEYIFNKKIDLVAKSGIRTKYWEYLKMM
jgi:predicted nucleotidyltransferase